MGNPPVRSVVCNGALIRVGGYRQWDKLSCQDFPRLTWSDRKNLAQDIPRDCQGHLGEQLKNCSNYTELFPVRIKKMNLEANFLR